MMWYNIKEIKTKNNIIEVARDLGYIPKNNWFDCINVSCRQVSKGQPTVKIDNKNERFECTICHEVKGDVIDFVQLYKVFQKSQKYILYVTHSPAI